MFTKSVKEFSFYPSSSQQCLIRVEKNDGRPLSFKFNEVDIGELVKVANWAYGQMMKLEKLEYDAEVEKAAQLEMDLGLDD